jgi:hypothetical protein
LHRQERFFGHAGLKIPRSTLDHYSVTSRKTDAPAVNRWANGLEWHAILALSQGNPTSSLLKTLSSLEPLTYWHQCDSQDGITERLHFPGITGGTIALEGFSANL